MPACLVSRPALMLRLTLVVAFFSRKRPQGKHSIKQDPPPPPLPNTDKMKLNHGNEQHENPTIFPLNSFHPHESNIRKLPYLSTNQEPRNIHACKTLLQVPPNHGCAHRSCSRYGDVVAGCSQGCQSRSMHEECRGGDIERRSMLLSG